MEEKMKRNGMSGGMEEEGKGKRGEEERMMRRERRDGMGWIDDGEGGKGRVEKMEGEE